MSGKSLKRQVFERIEREKRLALRAHRVDPKLTPPSTLESREQHLKLWSQKLGHHEALSMIAGFEYRFGSSSERNIFGEPWMRLASPAEVREHERQELSERFTGQRLINRRMCSPEERLRYESSGRFWQRYSVATFAIVGLIWFGVALKTLGLWSGLHYMGW